MTRLLRRPALSSSFRGYRTVRVVNVAALFVFGLAAIAASANGAPLIAPVKPPMTEPRAPVPASAAAAGQSQPNLRNPLPSSPAELFNLVPLGSTLPTLATRLGKPWFVTRLPDASYWAYSFDDDRAWFVVTVRAGKVECVQVLPKAHQIADLRDALGYGIGTSPPSSATTYQSPIINMTLPLVKAQRVAFGAPSTGEPRSSTVEVHRFVPGAFALRDGSANDFYVVDPHHRIVRFGKSTGLVDLPALTRWFQPNGAEALSPITRSMVGGGSSGSRSTFIAKYDQRWWHCGGGGHWTAEREKAMTFAAVSETEVSVSCSTAKAYHRSMFFANTDLQPRPFDVDAASEKQLYGTTYATSATTPQPLASGAQTGTVWFSESVNGAHWLYNNTSGNSDFEVELNVNSDQNAPVQQVVIAPVTPTPQPFVSPVPSSTASPIAVPFNAFTCAVTGGTVKCDPALNDQSANPNGAVCLQATAYFGTGSNAYTRSSQIACGVIVSDRREFEKCPTCGKKPQEVGRPFDVTTGTLWYKYLDARMSGPFGLEFARKYESDRDTYQGELGLGWRSTYGAFLDLSTRSKNAFVTFYDADGARTYFESTGPGSFYDQTTGSTLITNTDGTFIVQTWDHRRFSLDSSGRISQLIDRDGNTQTVIRDSSSRISTVTDVLGRTLAFGYSGTDKRVRTVTSTPTGVSLTFVYDSGTNCTTGDLCSVQESDGAKWSYQYVDEADGEHLLSEVVDPNGYVEESNTYGIINDGYGDDDYRITEQYVGASQDDLKLNYNNPGDVIVTDSPVSGQTNQTSYQYDQDLNEITSVLGFACDCGDAQKSFTYDPFGRLLTESELSTMRSYAYTRDIPFPVPTASGGTETLTAYPGTTQIVDNSTPSRTVNVIYNALTSSQQDLISSSNEQSVPQPMATAATTYTYNAGGHPTKIVRSGYVAATATAYTTTVGWDSNGRVTSVTLPRTDLSQTSTFSYFSNSDSDLARRGQLSSIADPLNHKVGFATASSGYGSSYTVYGEPQQITDQNGVQWLFMFDPRGRLSSGGINTADTTSYKNLPGTILTSYKYDSFGNLKTQTRTLGGEAYSYDTSERLQALALTDASATSLEQETFTYDLESEITGVSKSCLGANMACSVGSLYGTSVPAYSASYGYDANGALTTVNLGSVQGNSSSGGLPSPAPVASVLAATYVNSDRGDYTSDDFASTGGDVSDSASFDSFHQLTNITRAGPAGLSTTFNYDTQHNTSAITPGGETGTSYAYDDFGRVTSEASALTGTWSYAYDADGEVTSFTDPNKSVTTRTFDALNRPLSAKSVKSSSTESVTWTYDNSTAGAYGIGRLATMSDPVGTTTYSYEPRGFLAAKSQTIGSGTYATAYTYDVDDDLSTMTLPTGSTSSTGRVLTYTYDYAHRPTSVSGVLNGTTTKYVTGATYLPFGPRTQLVYGNGVTQTWTFNQRYLPYEDKIASGSTTISDVGYAENQLGEITQIDDLFAPKYNRTLTYGGSTLPTSMLGGVTTGAGLWGTASFAGQNGSYNTDGENLATEAVGNTSLALTYDTNDHLNGIATNGGTSVPATVDAAGNHTALNGQTYTYSPRNLMATGQSVTYGYDGFGQRLTTTKASNVQVSLYDQDGHLSTESALASASVLYDYVWFGGTPVAQETIGSSPSTVWTHTNELGAPFLQTSSAGSSTWQADYAPYGSIYSLRAGASNTHQPLRLPGQEAFITPAATTPNGLTQILYNHNRWYVPSVGRYLTPDPIRFSGDAFNQYSYTSDNPASAVDPSGLIVTGFPNFLFDTGFGEGVADGLTFGSVQLGNPAADDHAAGAIIGSLGSLTAVELAAAAAAAVHAESATDELQPLAAEATSVFDSEIGVLEGKSCPLAAETAGEGTVTLFRAIGQDEASSFLSEGGYAAGPSRGGKYFAFNLDGSESAMNFATHPFNSGLGTMTMTGVDVPESFLMNGSRFFDPGGAGASIHFGDEFLPQLNQFGPRIIGQ
jgi:RHS repeat-associated protein